MVNHHHEANYHLGECFWFTFFKPHFQQSQAINLFLQDPKFRGFTVSTGFCNNFAPKGNESMADIFRMFRI